MLTMDKIKELEAATLAAKEKADAAGGTDESLNQALKDAEAALEAAKKAAASGQPDIDFSKELDDLNRKPQRDEKDKARFTLKGILDRHPDLKDELTPKADDPVEQKLLRNQAEGVIRQRVREMGVKDEVNAVAYYLKFYDRTTKTGNIYDDVDDAMWLGDKNRTRNALSESKRVPPEPGAGGGAGHKPPGSPSVPTLPPDVIKRWTASGLKQIAPGHWEGTKIVVKWDKDAGKWDQTMK